jgi:hypothetical protein
MKRIARGIRKLNEHVATAGNFAQTAARQIEEIRHTVANTTGQLQSLRAELPQWANDLHAGSEERIAEALAEVNQSDELLEQAGFAIGGIDLEISPAQRVIVHLMMTREVAPREIERLAQSRPPGVQRALLSALAKARTMGQSFAPEGLPDHRVQIALGPIPTVRLVWRNEATDSPTPVPLPAASTGQSTAGAATPAFASSLSQSPGGFFGSSATIRLPESPAPTTSPSKPEIAHSPAEATSQLPAEAAPAPVDPLARFKVMPFKTR